MINVDVRKQQKKPKKNGHKKKIPPFKSPRVDRLDVYEYLKDDNLRKQQLAAIEKEAQPTVLSGNQWRIVERAPRQKNNNRRKQWRTTGRVPRQKNKNNNRRKHQDSQP